MLKHIWVDSLVKHPGIGLHFLHRYLPLVSAPTWFQVQDRQVSKIAYYLNIENLKHRWLRNIVPKLMIKCFCFIICTEGPSSTTSLVQTLEESTSNTIEVGQGSLKLLYSADVGKLTHYVNTRSLVHYFFKFQFEVIIVLKFQFCGELTGESETNMIFVYGPSWLL